MNLIKSQVTFSEVLSIARDIADSCFIKDDEGSDVDYSPACKQASIQVAFVENYTDFEFKTATNPEDKDEESRVFDENYSKYMNVNIEEFKLDTDESGRFFNKTQWDSILKSADELIEYRKQLLLKKNDNIAKLTEELLKKQIEAQSLQVEVLKQQKQMNEQYTKDELMNITGVFEKVNEYAKSPEYQKAIAKELLKGTRAKKYSAAKKASE